MCQRSEDAAGRMRLGNLIQMRFNKSCRNHRLREINRPFGPYRVLGYECFSKRRCTAQYLS